MDIQESLLPIEELPVASLEHNQLLERVCGFSEDTVLWLYSANNELRNAAMATVDEAVSNMYMSDDGAGASVATGLQTIVEDETEFEIDNPPVHTRRSIRRKPVPRPSDPGAAKETKQPSDIVDEAVINTTEHPSPSSVAPTHAFRPTCDVEDEFSADSPPIPPQRNISRNAAPEARSSQPSEESLLAAPTPTAQPSSHQPSPSSKRPHLNHSSTTYIERHGLTAPGDRAHLFVLDTKRMILQHRLTERLQQAWHKLKTTFTNCKNRYTHRSRTSPLSPTTLEHTPWVTYILDHHSPRTLQTARLMHQKRTTQESFRTPSWDDALKLLVAVDEANANRPAIVEAFHEAVRGMSMERVELGSHLREVSMLFRGQEDLLEAVREYWGLRWLGQVGVGVVDGVGVGAI